MSKIACLICVVLLVQVGFSVKAADKKPVDPTFGNHLDNLYQDKAKQIPSEWVAYIKQEIYAGARTIETDGTRLVKTDKIGIMSAPAFRYCLLNDASKGVLLLTPKNLQALLYKHELEVALYAQKHS